MYDLTADPHGDVVFAKQENMAFVDSASDSVYRTLCSLGIGEFYLDNLMVYTISDDPLPTNTGSGTISIVDVADKTASIKLYSGDNVVTQTTANMATGEYSLENSRYDLNKDGQININDITLIISSFGKKDVIE